MYPSTSASIDAAISHRKVALQRVKARGQMDQRGLPAHVLIFPFPVQGHVNSMLKLAELLSLSGLHVTFLNSDYNHRRLLDYTNIQARFTRYPDFRFETISDGLPADHPRSGGRVMELFDSLEAITKPHFREMLTSGRLSSDTRTPVTCVIADGVLSFAIDIANEIGIMSIVFRTISACCLWTELCFPQLIEAGEVPFKGKEDMDQLVTSVAGMEGFLRRRDLPGFCRVDDVSDQGFDVVMTETQKTSRADALILNTFEELEGPILSHIRSRCPILYTLGPLHAHLKTRLVAETTSSSSPSPTQSSSSLWKEDRSCMTWLDARPSKSVIYVSFGSITVFTRDQFMEFWYGLVNSKKSFLWVIRPDSVAGKDEESDIPAELSKGTKERGYMVDWAPQEEVLVHPAIGGFLTHSGWNSTLESIVAGVPMICWPYFSDQQVNSRFVSEVWKLGLDMKDTCDRGTVEKMVNDLMEVRQDEFNRSADMMAKLARKCVSEGGSSYLNLDRLIDDIRQRRIAED
ncbi:hypothetical protein L1049_011104 [Liquidambar formosana]|uniref:Glycosyltransferase n=1 Tax=Liquidambar formosana TaxID=63359 RepID=A0AAP0WWT0_LIQFO